MSFFINILATQKICFLLFFNIYKKIIYTNVNVYKHTIKTYILKQL